MFLRKTVTFALMSVPFCTKKKLLEFKTNNIAVYLYYDFLFCQWTFGYHFFNFLVDFFISKLQNWWSQISRPCSVCSQFKQFIFWIQNGKGVLNTVKWTANVCWSKLKAISAFNCSIKASSCVSAYTSVLKKFIQV